MTGSGIIVLPLLVGCSSPLARPNDAIAKKPQIDLSGNNPAGLPKFKLVKVLDGELIQLGPSDQVLVLPQKGDSYPTSPQAVSFEWLGNRPKDSELSLFTNGDTLPVSSRSYIDPSGATQQVIEDQPIQIDDAGQKIGIIPMRTTTPNARYYQSSKSIYGREAKSADIRKLYDKAGKLTNFVTFGDALYLAEVLPDQSSRITKITTSSPTKTIYQEQTTSQIELSQASDLDLLSVELSQKMATLRPGAEPELIANAFSDLAHYHTKDIYPCRICKCELEVRRTHPRYVEPRPQTRPIGRTTFSGRQTRY